QVLAQFRNLGVFTPDPLQLVVLLGATLILAVATFPGLVPLAKRSDNELFLSAWLGSTLLIIYLPVTFQIMMLNGIQVALGILATRGLFDHVLPWLRGALATRWPAAARSWVRAPYLTAAAAALFLALVLPTNLYLVAWRFIDLQRRDYPEFLYL